MFVLIAKFDEHINMKLLKLQFGGLLSNNDEEGTFTCILEEKNDDKRKLFLQLTKTEAEEILFYLRQNKTEEEAMPSEILKFVQSGYNIKNARIATNEDQHVGIVNIKRGFEKLEVLLSVCSVIILMKNYNVDTSIDLKSLNIIQKHNNSGIKDKTEKKSFEDNVFILLDEYIYDENYSNLRLLAPFVKKLMNKK